MPRSFNRKVEIRFDDSSLRQIDHVASALGLSRAEFVRSSVMASTGKDLRLQAPASSPELKLTVSDYHRMVSAAYRAAGGAVNRVQIETCVAAALQCLT
jgi:uncharacterized protein (DUF1778 family)